MSTAIAIAGMACRYPDARTPWELWENVLARRRAFRRLPPERLRLDDYFAADRGAPDRTYATQAAVIEDYEFDRVKYRVSGEAYRSADLSHWLALDVAAQALADAGFPEGEGLPREATGVLVGNTLTGEFSRANVLRLRWPYVRRVLEATLARAECPPERRGALLGAVEQTYKAPFPPPQGDTLAGGLSNTIAGRICNQFHLQGGGYTVDGACASSLLAVASACSALAAGDLDAALAGGVDLSLDPFELVGFAKAGALAAGAMRVYDRRSDGFWPGEGCGFVVLMRADEVRDRPVYAVIRGWGVSSDGAGGITRPEAAGQQLALRRAYRRAGLLAEEVSYFEGHGTGTAVGDATELEALARARAEGAEGRAANGHPPAAAIGSVKANIGHTKAAAGVAGLIKAAWALREQVVPPTTGCDDPLPAITGERTPLRAAEGGCWPPDRALYAGVSAMGFGGVNAHVVLEGPAGRRRRRLGAREQRLLCSPQDAELVVLGAASGTRLRRRVESLRACAGWLADAQLADLAAHQAGHECGETVRAAVVASSPDDLAGKLEVLGRWLDEGVAGRLDTAAGVFLGEPPTAPRIGFAFPGQGAPVYHDGGAWARRFKSVRELYARTDLFGAADGLPTAVAQPAIVAASLAGLRVLGGLGVGAALAVGHSLGELVALHWAGAVDEEGLLRLAAARGRAMSAAASPDGTMAAIGAGASEVSGLLNDGPAVIACLNSPRQTVISGGRAAVEAVLAQAQARGLPAIALPVGGAFHSPRMADAVPALAGHLAGQSFRPLARRVISSVTGGHLPPDVDVSELLCRQLSAPVRFAEAVSRAAAEVDLWLEVGPGRVLAAPLRDLAGPPSISLDAGGPSLRGLLHALAACYVLGAPVALNALFADRFARPIDPGRRPYFLANPCELAPIADLTALGADDPPAPTEPAAFGSEDHPSGPVGSDLTSVTDLIRRLVARRAELPPEAVGEGDRLLHDLHLNSITVGQLVAEASRGLGLPPPVAPTEFAGATVGEVARALYELARCPGASAGRDEGLPAGVDSWVRAFTVELVEQPLPHGTPAATAGDWQVVAAPGDPTAAAVRRSLALAGRGGVVVCLPPEPDERHVPLLLDGARAVLGANGRGCFVVVQHGGGGAAFARTLHLEAPDVTVCVVDVSASDPRCADRVAAEALAAAGYVEAHYDASGRRRVPVLRLLLDAPEPAGVGLGPDDVLLVTGGGKGIAAECALELARATGASLALVGRSDPAADEELAANLDRMARAGLRVRYLRADVTDPAGLSRALHAAEGQLGSVTAVLHGAGRNIPLPLAELDEAAFQGTLGPKVGGLRNLLGALAGRALRLLVTFGSVIARTGMPGEADYAVANEWLARLTERYQTEHPDCRCVAVEWSVWSGVGMGERLGRVEALARQGITPIPPDRGVAELVRLLGRSLPAPAVIVAGRLGDPPTLKVPRPELPFLRFLDRTRVYYPGVELIVEADLSSDTDPYLDDHVFQGERLFPAVLGLEAMAQVASVLAGLPAGGSPVGRLTLEDARFDRPVSVPAGETVTVRIATLARASGAIEVVLRSARTAFQVDHFRATYRVTADAAREQGSPSIECDGQRLELDPVRDMYGDLLFQAGRFRRLRGYLRLRAKECLADVVPGPTAGWFGHYLPPGLVLGEPGWRDAVIHSVQACIPHGVLLPVGLDRLTPGAFDSAGPYRVRARERSRAGDSFVYDLEVAGADGVVRERWEGLRLRRVAWAQPRGSWPVALLGPYTERRVADLVPGAGVAVAVAGGAAGDRRARRAVVLRDLLGDLGAVARRPDGKPVCVRGGPAVSVAHTDNLTVAVAGAGPTACDLEPVKPRPPQVWEYLLGRERLGLAELVRHETGEDLHTAATRVWAAGECVTKVGGMPGTPLVFSSRTADGWVLLAAGGYTVATLAAAVRGVEGVVILGVLAEAGYEGI
jgi:enediyne polyketide synthase